MQTDPIIADLAEKLHAAGPRRWKAIAQATGVEEKLPQKIAYGMRRNPTLRTVRPLLDFFAAIERGEAKLPAPDIDPRYLTG